MKITGKSAYRLLSVVLCICMVLSLLPALPMVAEAATVPTYIASIGVAQDGSSGSTGVNDCKSELAGHTIIDRDLNDDAGGDYVYMGYKTTTDPSKAITGIVFRVGENPPNSISYGGATFYLVGGSTEANTAKLGGYIDLNARAGGVYIYTYITRDTNYGAPLTAMTVNESSSYSGWTTGTNTDGNVIDLNQGAKGDYLYLHYQRFSGKASSTFYYLTSGGSRTSSTTSVSVKNHTQSVSTTPSKSSSVTYDGRTFTFRGWREDNTASSSTVTPSYTYMTSKTYRAVYSATVTLSYNANGGSGAPSRQTATQYINAGSSSVSKTSHSFTIPTTVPTHDNSKCIFLGWSTSSTATTASYQPGQTITISSNTTLYAVWQGEHPDKSYVNNGADHTYLCAVCGKYVTEGHSYDAATQLCVCGAINPNAVAMVSKNGKVVAAYLSLNDAIQAVANCTAADGAVVTILKDIALGNNYQKITSGVFTIDLNGHEISSTNSSWGVLVLQENATKVTIQGAGENSKITGNSAGIEMRYGGNLTIAGGTISGGTYSVYAFDTSTVTISGGTISDGSYGVYAKEKCTVTISGGTISGGYGGVCAYENSTVTITGGTISGGNEGVCAYGSTVTITGGTISGVYEGVYAYENRTVTISGGSISGGDYDIWNSDSTITLTLGENGVGATFPGGIEVYGTTLNAILGEGAAYWQGNIMVLPADDATEIIGDVVIKSTCPHTASKSHYADLQNGASHTCLCSGCNNIIVESHSYTNYLCACGAVSSDAVASVSKNGIVTGAYTTLNEAIQAVKNCTAADQAVVTILQNIVLGDSYQEISSGVFTINLNGHEISSTNSSWGVLVLQENATKVTIQGAGENSKITGNYAGIDMRYGGNVTIAGGTISGDWYGVNAYSDCAVTISGGSISGVYEGVYACENSTVTITGGTISGGYYGVDAYDSTVTISGGTISSGGYGVDAQNSIVNIIGGSISGNTFDINNSGSAIGLGLGENGMGATFPGGITVCNASLNVLLGEGAAYWQGSNMILLTGHATEITGGDVVIKATCSHTASKSNYTDLKDGASHTYLCSGCNNTLTEGHTYTDGLCVCGAVHADMVASVSKNGIVTGAYTTLNDAIQAVANCTADDEAVVTILKDIDLGDSYQRIEGGVFTIDLNGHEISSTKSNYGALYIFGAAANVTIQGAGENSKITGTYAGIEVDSDATLMITGGSISGDNYGVYASNSAVTITGGTISGNYGVYANYSSVVEISGGTIGGMVAYYSTVTISGGTVSGGNYGVDASYSTVTVSGGTISGTSGGMVAYENSTVTITGGSISGGYEGVRIFDSTVTISGGSISGGNYDIWNYNSTITLTLGENGVGATFPDGIKVSGTTLNAILGEGAAYWQGSNMIIPSDDAEEITGGDVVIKKACPHASKSNYTDLNDGASHTYLCSGCNNTLTEGHTYTDGLCVCGAAHPDMVASTTVNGVTTYHLTLNDAIQAVANCTVADKAVVTILKDIALGNDYQTISSGVFTIDLNGFEISSTNSDYGVLYIEKSATNVTIQGTGENSKITGSYAGIQLNNGATLTVISGTISGEEGGVYASNSTVTINGGTISGEQDGVMTRRTTVTIGGGTISGKDIGVNHSTGTLTISGGTISGGVCGISVDRSTMTFSGGTVSDGNIRFSFTGVRIFDSTVTISGGSISSDDCDISIVNHTVNSIIALTLGENGVGATFPGGINVFDGALNEILGEGAAYWQGDKQIIPADDDCVITGGDVIIKAECKHSGDKTYTNNGDDHTYTCSSCNVTVTEGHTYIDGVCVCGVADINVAVASTTVGGITTYYGTLGSAIQAVKDCTAADKAVVTILKDIALGDYYQTISSGVFTIDLNGHEISSTNDRWGALYLSGADVNVTIQGTGESSKITGSADGITVFDKATLTITGGTISGEHGVYAAESTVIISGGTISGERGVYIGFCTLIISDGTISGRYGVSAIETDLIISDGTISGDVLGVHAEFSTVTISGGSISAGDRDIYSYYSTTTLTLGENGEGARFPGGITVTYATLNEILGEGAAYWQGDKQIIPADDAAAIFDGDVVIKAVCKHTGDKTYTNNGDNHSYFCSSCGTTFTEGHTYIDDSCICGAFSPKIVATVSKNGIVTGKYTTLNDAIQAVANCTAADKAVVTILQKIDLGTSYQSITSGVFTIDLNGNEIINYNDSMGVLILEGAATNVTIQGVGEDSKIDGYYAGIGVNNQATLMITGGTIRGDYGVRTFASTVTVSGGTIRGRYAVPVYNGGTATITGGTLRGEFYGVYAVGSTATITGGTIDSDYYGVAADDNSTMIITGGTISGEVQGANASNNSDVTISGGSISGENYGVYAKNSDVTISGGTISGAASSTWSYGLYVSACGDVTISGGSIFGKFSDIVNYDSTITLTLGKNGVGARFPGGITVERTTLNAILGAGAAYWQGDKQMTVIDGATSITGGDVVVKADASPVYSGWTKIDGNWYYYNPDTGKPVTGVTRVPYPAEAINGVTYAPNAEDVAYYENKGQTFIDKDVAWFVFDENGVFQSNLNGMTSDNRWAVNGCIVWHVGLVQVGQDYYYFIGDADDGGNKLATGDIYAGRNTTDFDMVVGGVYTFGADGKLCKNEGIVDLRYYENYRLMLGNGLTKVGENYIYVDSNGELIVDSQYYVPANDVGIAVGMYFFDENGFMVDPVSSDKDGIFYENGAWYYYEAGKIAGGKGLIHVSTNWHYEDGSTMGYTAFIYVRSNGQLATGEYYITNVSDDFDGMYTVGQKVIFSEDGMACASKDGIYDENGSLYYYEKNQIQYNAGLIEVDGGWIYVRSNGQLALGDYWITNTNGNMDQGMYEFGADGFMVVTDTADGIVNDNGVLYYYLDGKKQYGLGLVQLDDGSYIYVRTNGELATGSYWITNHNGLLPEGMYTFGDDGVLTVN